MEFRINSLVPAIFLQKYIFINTHGNKEQEYLMDQMNTLGVWLAIGVGIGLIFGTMFNQIGHGIALGAAIGLIIGFTLPKKEKT